jgi:hypothetical protein
MRFEKLRINVAIALVVFILIVGNILVFGLVVTPKNTQPAVTTPADNSAQVSNQDTQPAAQNPPTAVPVQQNPTPIFQTFNTRAS